MSTKPPRFLYLQTHDDSGDEVGEQTHCDHRIYRFDTRYTKARLLSPVLKQHKKAMAILRELHAIKRCEHKARKLPHRLWLRIGSLLNEPTKATP